MDKRYGGRLSFLDDNVLHEISKYLTVGERYGIKTMSLVKFVRGHVKRARLRQPVIPYYSVIRYVKHMSGMHRCTKESSPKRFFYRPAKNRFQMDLTIFRVYHYYHTDHIDYDWEMNIHPQWKTDGIDLDRLFTACIMFESPYIRRITRMCHGIRLMLHFNQPNYVGYFVPVHPIMTHQCLLEKAHEIIHSLSIFLEKNA